MCSDLILLLDAVDGLLGIWQLGGNSISAASEDHKGICALVVGINRGLESRVEPRSSLDPCLGSLASLRLPNTFLSLVCPSLT